MNCNRLHFAQSTQECKRPILLQSCEEFVKVWSNPGMTIFCSTNVQHCRENMQHPHYRTHRLILQHCIYYQSDITALHSDIIVHEYSRVVQGNLGHVTSLLFDIGTHYTSLSTRPLNERRKLPLLLLQMYTVFLCCGIKGTLWQLDSWA